MQVKHTIAVAKSRQTSLEAVPSRTRCLEDRCSNGNEIIEVVQNGWLQPMSIHKLQNVEISQISIKGISAPIECLKCLKQIASEIAIMETIE
jgi:hypothetical protein